MGKITARIVSLPDGWFWHLSDMWRSARDGCFRAKSGHRQCARRRRLLTHFGPRSDFPEPLIQVIVLKRHEAAGTFFTAETISREPARIGARGRGTGKWGSAVIQVFLETSLILLIAVSRLP